MTETGPLAARRRDGGPGRGRGRRTQAERRAASERRLLTATAQLIAERGTTAVGFGEIAKAAGVSHGLPSYLFGTKVDLLCALVDDFAVRVRDLLRPAVGDARGMAALRITMRVIADSLRDPWPQTRALNILLGEALGAEPELRATVNRYHAQVRGLIAGWVREGIADGDIRPDVDAEAQAVLWIGVIRGLSYQAIADPEAVPLDAVGDELLAALERVLAPPA
jgi:AcrR family transcriptional regulator